MKVVRSICILVAIMLPPASMAAESFFIRTLGGPDNDRVGASAQVGDLVYFGGVKDLNKGLLLATTVDGDVVFEKVFSDPTGSPVEITALEAGAGVLYAAGNIGTWPVSGQAFVMALASGGEILSQTVFQNDKQAFVRDMIVTRDGGLLIFGKLVVPPDTFGGGWVAKLDPFGAIEWQKEIGTGGNDSLNAAVELPEGGYVLAGGIGDPRNPAGVLQGWLLSLDASGNLVWQNGFVAATGDEFTSLIVTRNGITAIGYFCEFCFFRGDGWIVDTDLNGNLLGAKFIGDFQALGFDEIIAAEPVAKGKGYIVFGSSDTIVGPLQQMWAARFSNRGDLRWVRQIGGPGFEMGGAMTVLDRGSIVFGGYSVADLNQNVYIGKIDEGGRQPTSCAEVAALGPDAFRDDGGQTVAVRVGATSQDSGAVTAPGTLIEDVSPTPVNDLVCFQ